MFCGNCGTENSETEQFCRTCGTFLRWEVTDRRVSDTGFRLVLEVWRVWAPRIDDAEGQLHFHNERARLLQSLVDGVGLHVTDWGDTFHGVAREKVWVRAEASSEAAVGEVIRQTGGWVRSGELKNAFITVGEGAMTPVIGLDPETWLRDSSPDTTAVTGGGGYAGGNAAPDYTAREATRMAEPRAAGEHAERERAELEEAERVEAERAPIDYQRQQAAAERAERERLEAERAAIDYQRRAAGQDAQRQQERRRPAPDPSWERPPAASRPSAARRPSLDRIREAPREVARRVKDIRKRIQGQRAKPALPPEPVAANGGGRDASRNGGREEHPEPVAANGGGRGPAGNGGHGPARNGGGARKNSELAAPQPPKPNGGRGQRAKPPDRDTPGHEAYGLLTAPAEVVAHVEFDLVVGLSEDPAPGVAGPSINLPPVEVEPYSVDVRIAAPGFEFPRGQKRRVELKVHKGDAYPKKTIRLIPKSPPGDADVLDRPITAEYSIGGERLGDAIRSVRVLKAEALRTLPEEERVETGVNVPAPTGEEKADLTITIRYSDRPPIMEWTVDSPHNDIVTPTAKPFEKPLPNADDFLRNAILQIDGAEGKEGVFSDVLALGSRVAQSIPPDVWKAIRAVATKRGEPPTILLVSEEPFVPWELAKVDPPLVVGTDHPPFLSAQARIGRWVQATEVGADGRSRPSPMPPARKDVATVGVVSGSYAKTTWTNLAHARAEAKELARLYGAKPIKAGNKDMYNLLRGIPPADLLHFAVHGRYNPQNPGQESGIILTDGNSLHANEIAARDLATNPVVFLNACQVGAGLLELGAYSGVAAAFVEAGASAVVAPLWKVDDGIAKDIALAFYVAASKGEPLSEVLRKAREPFVDEFETKSATWMAYQLFGHPSFVIGGLQAR